VLIQPIDPRKAGTYRKKAASTMENISGTAQMAAKVLTWVSPSILFHASTEPFLSTQVTTVARKSRVMRKAPVATNRYPR
jgi:hypothetical protein